MKRKEEIYTKHSSQNEVDPYELYTLWKPTRFNERGDAHISTWCNELTLRDYKHLMTIPASEFVMDSAGSPYEKHLDATNRVVSFLADMDAFRPGRWLVYGKSKVQWGAVCLPMELPSNGNPLIEIPGYDDMHLVVCPTTEPK